MRLHRNQMKAVRKVAARSSAERKLAEHIRELVENKLAHHQERAHTQVPVGK